MPRVTVRLPGRSYPLEIGHRLMAAFPRWIAAVTESDRLLVVADRNAFRHHGTALRESLDSRFDCDYAVIPPGERSKSLTWARRLYERCRRLHLGRDGLILAFGGGVVGDLAGFVAATWQRGVGLVMAPTTLLAQVDSAVGGKVGVNFAGVKNLVGAFCQPRLVLSDTAVLATLPRREFRSALAEVVKYGMIADPALLTLVERHLDGILAGEPGLLIRVVAACSRIKARVVEADELETGLRTHLNYGHTLGHALEAAAGGRLRHGEAVALGMRGAARLAEELGFMSRGDRERQDRLLDRIGLPSRIRGLTVRDVYPILKWDKKIRDLGPRFVLTRGVGFATVAPLVDEARVRRVLAALLA